MTKPEKNAKISTAKRQRVRSRKGITLSDEQMRQIARHEITFREFLPEGGADGEDVVFHVPSGAYAFTLEDLYHAVKALKEENPTVDEFAEYWFDPITEFSKAFGLDRMLDEELELDDVPENLKKYDGLLMVSERDHFMTIWYELESAWEDAEGEECLAEVIDLDSLIADVERYFSNKGKPLEEWTFSKEEMEDYIRSFQDDDYVKEADEEKLILARRFTDRLCAEDSGLALYLKGYACYGGNRLYPCDWNISRDCILRLFEKEDDPQYANTLGYIYYYGRCTGGVPEYDKAFYYFGIAAANGLYEGMYKLADMFSHGYGCKQSKRTARTLYNLVYDDSFKNFLKGKEANFADAALRMGNVYAKGIDAEADITAAYHYYLQADYAARQRAQRSDFFGNTTVAINVRNALEKTREQLTADYFKEYTAYIYPFLFEELAEGNYRCELTKRTNADGHTELAAKRLPTSSVPEPEGILVTIPQLSLCTLTTEVSFTVDDSAVIWFRGKADRIRYDYCEWNAAKDRYEFYYDAKLVAWSKSEEYRLYGNPPEEAHGPEYRLVSVRFGASGRTYDYICDDESVQAGDRVVVEGYDGETEVEVIKVAVRRESELGLPAERYKRILRKC